MPKAPKEIRSLARAHTASAIKVLAGIMNEKKSPAAARVAAANALLDRGWGRAPQEVYLEGELNVTNDSNIPRPDSYEEWLRYQGVAAAAGTADGGDPDGSVH